MLLHPSLRVLHRRPPADTAAFHVTACSCPSVPLRRRRSSSTAARSHRAGLCLRPSPDLSPPSKQAEGRRGGAERSDLPVESSATQGGGRVRRDRQRGEGGELGRAAAAERREGRRGRRLPAGEGGQLGARRTGGRRAAGLREGRRGCGRWGEE